MSTAERAQTLYIQGRAEFESNREVGLQLLTESASLGNIEAAYLLHSIFFMIDPYRTDEAFLARGMEYLKQAADAEYPDAMAQCSLYLANGMFDLPQDLQGSFKLAQAAAVKGSSMGHVIMASFYRNGSVVPRNSEKMIAHLEVAAANGDPLAACCLGDVYAEGMEGVSVNEQKALPYYFYAAQEGYASAQAGYARLLLKRPECTEKDAAVCVDILESLAAEGNDRAMVALGLECVAGRHVAKDLERAEVLFLQAEEIGNKQATVELGRLAAE